jgi:hypothetical protein
MGITAWQRARITAVMAIAFMEEHTDAMLLSAMYLAISRALHITATQMGALSMWRALVQVQNSTWNLFSLIIAVTSLDGQEHQSLYAQTCMNHPLVRIKPC